MEGSSRHLLTGLLLCAFLVLQASCQKLDECKKTGDYLWKKSSANKFYFCYRTGNAMAMECLDNRYMCKVPGKVFAPCMCIKSVTSTEDDSSNPEISYDECEEQFRLIPATGRSGGKVVKDALTDELCSQDCLNMVHCLAYSFRPASSECRIYLPKNEVPTLQTETGVNYFVKKACALKFGYKHREVKIGEDDGQSATATTQSPGGSNTAAGAASGSTDNVEGKEGGEEDPYHNSDDSDSSYTTPATPRATTTTIPDSGCPYGLKKIDNMSHAGGVLLKHIDDIERCKGWCLNVGYCKGVDFDEVLKLCYYHRVIEDQAMVPAESVWHIRKLHCQPPLKCWSQISYNSSNVDPSTPQIPCQGVCFVREKIFNSYSVFERGCHAASPPYHVGCEVDGALTGLTCFCSTDRCNGLSIGALTSVMLHLPLDHDGADASGLYRDANVALNYQMPSVSCLEKAINCSMVFDGNQCLEVAQMASQAYGEPNLQNEFTAMVTISVWFKRAEHNAAEIQGILGNSWDPNVPFTWAFMTSNVSSNANVGSATIVTEAQTSDATDFPYIIASPHEWHLLVLTYDSTYNPDTLEFPIVRAYLDGMEVPGNMHSDVGRILVRRQPVTVGCVMGKAFVGFIDDVRIFASALSKADIQALLQMNDGLYY